MKMWMVDDATAWQMHLDDQLDTAYVLAGTGAGRGPMPRSMNPCPGSAPGAA